MTIESIINAFEKDFVSMLCGATRVKLQPKLCEDLYYVYEWRDGHLYCYEQTSEGTIGDRIDALTVGQFYRFFSLLFTVIERKARKEGQHAVAREFHKMNDGLYEALFN